MGKIKLRKELNDELYLQHRDGVGVKKHEIKDEHNSSPYIHSDETYKTYKKQVNKFVDWCYKSEYKYSDGELKTMVEKYLESLKDSGQSAWTISTVAYSIAKAMNCKVADFGVEIPKRHRGDVVRSRTEAARDKRVSLEKNSDLITFCKCTGLRRHELEALKTENIIINSENKNEIWVEVESGKGGKYRTVRAVGSPTELNAIRRMVGMKEGKMFLKIHQALDVHALRSIYACRVYKSNARELKEIPKGEKYFCRGDKRGVVYDKKAMRVTSNMLGHDRICVIAESYLHNL